MSRNIKLSEDAFDKFLKGLYEKSEPNSILKKAAEDYKKAIEDGTLISDEEENGEDQSKDG